MLLCEIEKIPVSKAREILMASGINVSMEQAALILEFLMKMTRIAYENFFDKTP